MLPRVNETSVYETRLPSTGEKVKFRPFLMREEKILLIALETNDPRQFMESVINTVLACVTEPEVKRRDLTTFDVEHLLVRIRAKSVGEKTEVSMLCECGAETPVVVDLEKTVLEVPKVDPLVKLNDRYSVKMKWPSFDDVADPAVSGQESQVDATFSLMAKCIDSVLTDDAVVKTSEYSIEDVVDFLESLNSTQFEALNEWVKAIPSVRLSSTFTCSCGKENPFVLEGLSDLFTYASPTTV